MATAFFRRSTLMQLELLATRDLPSYQYTRHGLPVTPPERACFSARGSCEATDRVLPGEATVSATLVSGILLLTHWIPQVSCSTGVNANTSQPATAKSNSIHVVPSSIEAPPVESKSNYWDFVARLDTRSRFRCFMNRKHKITPVYVGRRPMVRILVT